MGPWDQWAHGPMGPRAHYITLYQCYIILYYISPLLSADAGCYILYYVMCRAQSLCALSHARQPSRCPQPCLSHARQLGHARKAAGPRSRWAAKPLGRKAAEPQRRKAAKHIILY